MSKPKSPISIAICAFNAIEYTRLLVDSIRRHSIFDHEILIYSDGSSDGTSAWLRDQQDIIWRHDRRNRGICTAMNRVAKMASREYLFFPNTDHVLAPGWDELLVPRLSPRKVVSLQCIEPGTVPVASIFHARNCGTRWDEFDEGRFHAAVKELARPGETPGVNYPFVISKSLWQALGGLDERFDPGPANDPDLFYRLSFVDAEMVRAEDVIIYHFSGKSSRMAGEAQQERTEWHLITDRNEGRFVEKWGERYQYANGGLPNPGSEARRRWQEIAPSAFRRTEVRGRLRVGIDARSVRSQQGGIGIYTENLIRALARADQGLELHCFTNEPALLGPLGEELRNVIVRETGLPEGQDLSDDASYQELKFDVFHGPSFMLPERLKCPGIVTVHDLAFIHHPKWYPKEFVDHLREVLKRSLKSATAVIAVSDRTRDELRKFYPHITPEIHRVYEALPEHARISLGSDEANTLRSKYAGDAEFILSVGVQQKRKNALGLVEAFASIRSQLRTPYKLVLVGGSECEEPRLKDAIGTLGLSEQVVLTAHIPSRDLAALYSTCKAFVYPSLHEGFGLPVLEAMWHGAPVLCSDSGALPEVAGKAARVFRSDDTKDLAASLTEILANPDRRSDLASLGREQQKKFSWEQAAAETLSIYRSVAVSARSRLEPAELRPPLTGSRMPYAPVQLSGRPRIAIDARLFGLNRFGTGRYSSEIIKALTRTVTSADFVLIGPKALAQEDIPKGTSVVQHVSAGPETLMNASWEQFSLSSHLLGCDAYFAPTGILPVARPCTGVTVVHDLGYVDRPEYYDPPVLNHLGRWVRNACLSAEMVIAVSEFTSRRVIEHYQLSPDKVRVVRHGRTARAAAPGKAPAAIGSEPYLLCVSSLEPNKNIPTLIEAFSSVTEHWHGNLLIAGRRGRDLERVQQTITGARMDRRIRVVLEPSDDEIDTLYSRASAFAFPSVYEGFGLPLLEAMSHGVPVIANRIASCPEVVGEAGVLVETPDAKAWGDCLKAVLPDASRLEQLGSAARTRSLEFSWDRAAKETWSAIETCMRSR